MRTTLRILIALAVSAVLIVIAYSHVEPQILPILLAFGAGAAGAYAINIGVTAFFEAASPATKAQRRLVRDVEQAVERRRLQQEQAQAAESRSSTSPTRGEVE